MKLTDLILTDPPKFHYWDNKKRIGGFGVKQLELLSQCLDFVDSGNGVNCIETGAGLSTAWFLGNNTNLTSFFIEQALGERISAYLKKHAPETIDRWKCTVGPSELTLPDYINSNPDELFEICLIDGGHGIQTVFTDFTYQYYLLRKGGIILIDDIQIGSCRLVFELMKAEDGFEFFEDAGKIAAFIKTTDHRFLPDWGGQKFLDPLMRALTSAA